MKTGWKRRPRDSRGNILGSSETEKKDERAASEEKFSKDTVDIKTIRVSASP